jgi:hypothetical protein
MHWIQHPTRYETGCLLPPDVGLLVILSSEGTSSNYLYTLNGDV